MGTTSRPRCIRSRSKGRRVKRSKRRRVEESKGPTVQGASGRVPGRGCTRVPGPGLCTTASVQPARRFEDLWIWQAARVLVVEIYRDFRSGTGAKDFGFRDQVRRAATSVMSNVAEGFERSADADFARFLDFAKASCAEVRSLYYAAEDLGYVSPARAEEVRSSSRRLSAAIASLACYLRQSK